MRKKYAFLCFSIILFCLGGCASTLPPDRDFDKVDVDDDGFVTWEEHKTAFPGASKNEYLQFDEDNDERLDINEWRAGVGVNF